MTGQLVIGSRGSDLALTQSRQVAALLEAAHPGLTVRIDILSTKGDRVLDTPLAKIGGKGLFTEELEASLLDGSIDLAVHSLKDLPTTLPDGLCLAAVSRREDPRDALVCATATGLDDLPRGARVGTSSLRRRAQLLARRPDLEVVDLRGNVPTRLRKLTDHGLDAIVLAAAGLHRLNLAGRVTAYLEADTMLPAVGQGALGLETRAGDTRVLDLVAPLHDPATAAETTAERTLLAALGGGCQVPIGARARVVGAVLEMEACVCSGDGRTLLRASHHGTPDAPEALGQRAADALKAQGADAIIARGEADVAAAAARPLRGRRIVVTRSRTGAGRLEQLLAAEGAVVHAFPTIDIVPRDEVDLPAPAAAYAWVVFTSANAVDALDAALRRAGRALAEFTAASVCAIGPGTAAALARHGVSVRLTPDEAIAEAVADALTRIGGLSGARILLPKGNLARTVLPEALRALGADVEECVVYDTVPVPHDAAACDTLRAFAPEIITFASASAVDFFVAGLPDPVRAGVLRDARVAVIGPITAAAARRHGIVPAIASTRHDLPGLVEAIVRAERG